jgi:uncharacterized protein YjiS (DUF1127 family)
MPAIARRIARGLIVPDALAAIAHRIRLWRRLHAERRALERLDARLLRDIGLDAAAVAREAARPFWDAPRGR